MRRWGRRLVLAVIVVLTVAALAAALYQATASRRDLASLSPPGTLVDVGGHRLHIWCTGTGAPTVVLDTGLGGTAFDWGYVQPEVAEFTRVCSYDRAGMGYSEAGPRPRTSQQIVRELLALLEGSGTPDPVILVGASIGGWNVRLFASTHPNRVAGLVLVDARHEEQGQRLTAAGAPENPRWVAPVARLSPAIAYLGIPRLLGVAPGPSPDSLAPAVRGFAHATRFRSSMIIAAGDELAHAAESAAQIQAARRDLTVPLVVVSAGRRGHTRVAEVLDSLQRDQLTLSRRSCQVTAERSGHAIVLEQPEIVADTIRATVEASRQSLAPDCNSITQRGPTTSAR